MATTKYWSIVYHQNHLDAGHFYRFVGNVSTTTEKNAIAIDERESVWVEVTGDLKTALTDPADTRLVDDRLTRYNFTTGLWVSQYVNPEVTKEQPSPDHISYEDEIEMRDRLIKAAEMRKLMRDCSAGFSVVLDNYITELNNLGIATGRDVVFPPQPWASSVKSNVETGFEDIENKKRGQSLVNDPNVTPRFSAEGYVNG
jgi:hypothetical protein